MKKMSVVTILCFVCMGLMVACSGGDDSTADGDVTDGDVDVTDGDVTEVEENDECSGDGMEMCGDECVNTATNKLHCGGCNNECQGAATCTEGVCTCSEGLAYCNGECVNLSTDADHCGECLNGCQDGQICYGGECRATFDEICDNVDNDLDGVTDEAEDGTPLSRSCDNLCGPGTETCTEGEWTGCTAPVPTEEVCNGEDDNCDGLVDEGVTTTYYEDFDADGFGDPDLAWSTEACSLPPAGSSQNGADYVEDNQDCNDENPDVYPGAEELCDGQDNNCNTDVDENCPCTPIDGTEECGSDVGMCVKGIRTCTAEGWSECGGEAYVPAAETEICNMQDDDCDGETDEELADDSWDTFSANDTCETASALPDILEGGETLEVSGLSLYHGSLEGKDADWFHVEALEASHIFACMEHLFEEQCNFLFLVTFTPPTPEMKDDYVMCVHDTTFARDCDEINNTFCTSDADAQTWNEEDGVHEMVLAWSGTCGLDDSWNFFVEVKNAEGADNTCMPYDLSFDMGWTGEVGDQCQ